MLPAAKLPKRRIYPLPFLEPKVMKEYVRKDLYQGFIWPSTSPAASSFFFVDRHRGMRPCIDYRLMNSQIVQLPSQSLGPSGPSVHKVGPAECIQLHSHLGGWWMEDDFHYSLWPLWVPGHAMWTVPSPHPSSRLNLQYLHEVKKQADLNLRSPTIQDPKTVKLMLSPVYNPTYTLMNLSPMPRTSWNVV